MTNSSGRNVLITGATGQDAHYVAKLCSERGDYVAGVSRVMLKRADYKYFHRVTDWADLYSTMEEVQPDEIYHLAARHRSSEQKEEDERGVFLDNIRMAERVLSTAAEVVPRARVLLAGSCRVFGVAADARCYLRESGFMDPDDGYGTAKLAALQLGQAYRRAGFGVCTAILFNHESPLRSADYVTQKIAMAAARKQRVLVRDRQARVDWGHAADYARAMVMMLGAERLDDYVVSGEKHSVLDFARIAYEHVGLDWKDYVTESGPGGGRAYFGDCARITRELGWSPEISFDTMVREMVREAVRVMVR